MNTKLFAIPLVAAIVAGCASPSMNQQQQQTATGAGIGAAVGAGIGNLIGKNTKATAIGAAVGAAVGGGVGYNWAAIRGDLSKDTQGTGTQITEQQDGTLKVDIPSSVSFDTNSAAIKPTFATVLRDVAQTLGKNPNVHATVIGHTDSTGSASYNQQLSVQRAHSVVSALVNNGVAANRLSAEGRGASMPVADNSTEAGRTQNRRVEITLRAVQ